MRRQSMESFRSFDYEKELQRAKWYKEDVEKGGWSAPYKDSEVTCWSKTFPDDQVPIKIVYEMPLPFPAEVFLELIHPRNVERRLKWDRAFFDHKALETYPEDGGYVGYMRAKLKWPLTDRSYVLLIPPTKEVDWFGKKSYLVILKNAWHPSRPVGEDGTVRAFNGINYFVLTPDDKEPAAGCHFFGLSNNNFNGCMPTTGIEGFIAKKFLAIMIVWRECMIEGYNKYFKNE